MDGNPISLIDPTGNYGMPRSNDPKAWAYYYRMSFYSVFDGSGCGDSSSDWYVPDYFPNSCKKHDRCYKDQCGQEKCDKDFLEDMKKERPDMKFKAYFYYWMVFIYGNDAYRK